jgi:hypothetical protein
VFTFSAFHLASIALVVQLVPAANATSGQSLYGLMGFGVGTTLGIALAGRAGRSAGYVDALPVRGGRRDRGGGRPRSRCGACAAEPRVDPSHGHTMRTCAHHLRARRHRVAA